MAGTGAIVGTGLKHASVGGYLDYFFNYTLGGRGLFIYSPICIVGLYCLVKYRKKFSYELAAFFFFLLATTLTSNNYSGGSFGVRWHLLAIPFLIYAAYPFFEKPTRTVKAIATTLTVAGLAFAIIGSINPYVGGFYNHSSLRAQFSKEEKYMKLCSYKGYSRYKEGKLHYAAFWFKDCLRRDPSFTEMRRALARVDIEIAQGKSGPR